MALCAQLAMAALCATWYAEQTANEGDWRELLHHLVPGEEGESVGNMNLGEGQPPPTLKTHNTRKQLVGVPSGRLGDLKTTLKEVQALAEADLERMRNTAIGVRARPACMPILWEPVIVWTHGRELPWQQ